MYVVYPGTSTVHTCTPATVQVHVARTGAPGTGTPSDFGRYLKAEGSTRVCMYVCNVVCGGAGSTWYM